MERLRTNKANRCIAGSALVIWYLWSIMFVCFTQLLIEADAPFAGLSAQNDNIAQASVAHGAGSCDATVNVDAGSCESESEPGVAPDLPQLGVAALQFAWYLIPDWHESIAPPIVHSILKIPALQIFLQICAFLK